MTEPNGNSRPASWRDVYTLVQDVEARLTDRLEAVEAVVRELHERDLVATDRRQRSRQHREDWRTWLLAFVAASQFILGAYLAFGK